MKAAQATSPKFETIVKHAPRLADHYRELVESLEQNLTSRPSIPRARAELRKLLGGKIRIVTTPDVVRFETEKGRAEAAFLSAAGLGTHCAVEVVAGAGFEPATFGL